MTLDIRLPVGLLFTLIGALLLLYGLTHGATGTTPGLNMTADALTITSGGLNINADWGAVLMVFGVSMLLLARRAARVNLVAQAHLEAQTNRVVRTQRGQG